MHIVIYSIFFIFFNACTSASPLLGVQVKKGYDSASILNVELMNFDFVRYGIWLNNEGKPINEGQIRSDLKYLSSRGINRILITVRYPILAYESLDKDELDRMGRLLGHFIANGLSDYGYLNDQIYWEFLNEPDLPAFWSSALGVDGLVRFTAAFCSERESFPDAKIVAFGLSTSPAKSQVVRRILDQALFEGCFDAVSFHAYGMTVVEIQETALFIKRSYKMQSFVTEWGVPRFDEFGAAVNRMEYALAVIDALCFYPLIGFSFYELNDSANAKNPRERSFGLFDSFNRPLHAAKLLIDKPSCSKLP
jgi:hypothetical protein